mmetsp:Transcript_61867/g.191706  ORF Transcript_61867/g.191706 Transcript_61867/m.191706 type:complete len:243 (+) Transcript_61867:995-1723(+)
MAVFVSDNVRSSSFFLSSDRSNSDMQYSFLWSSSNCSVFRVATMPSIIPMTFSKPIFLPRSARRIRSMRTWSGRADRAWRRVSMALARSSDLLSWTCTKLVAGLGRVFLNRSKASSSFKTLIVSASATSSAALVFTRSSHSAVFVEQLFSKFAANSLSARSASSVSPRSFFICATQTPSSLIFSREVSILAVSTVTSFFLAAESSSNAWTAASSVAVASARPLAISSPICFRMPVIWPLCGA